MSTPRSLHLEVQAEAVDHLRAGRSVDLVGPAGSGRTTVLAEVCRTLLDDEWTVLRVQGVAALRDRPLEALAVAGLTSRADRTAPSAVAGAVAAIEGAVRPARTLVVVDDADDLDRASSGALVAAHARARFAVLSASRPQPSRLRDPYRLATEVRPGVELQVPALGYVDTQTLLADLLPGTIDAATVGRLYAAAGGLPGLVTALAVNARRRGRLALVDGTWVAGPDMWTPALARSVAPLVQDLSDDALEALETLSLAGAVTTSTARSLVAPDALEELDACRLLRFVPRGDQTVVGVFPQAVADHYRHLGTSARRLRIEERLRLALHVAGRGVVALPAAPRPDALDDAPAVVRDRAPWESDTVRHRMLVEHWYRETVYLRTRWETEPSPATAVPYLRALLTGDADGATVRAVVEGTPRTGDARSLAALDNWHALAVAFVEKDLDAARRVLRTARAEAGAWAPLLANVEAHLALLLDRAPDEPPALATPGEVEDDVAATAATVRAEWLVFRGDPAAALDLLAEPRTRTPHFASSAEVLRGLALLLDDRLDEAYAWSARHLDEARSALDVDAVHGHAFVVSVVLLLRGRTAELHEHLGSVLSTGLLSALQRPFQSANLSLAAAVALVEGRTTTARSLAEQSRSLGPGPSPLPLAQPTWTLARLGAGSAGFAATDEAAAADALWADHEDALARGFLVAAASSGALSLDLVPDPRRATALLDLVADLPAGLLRHVERFAAAVASDDPDVAAGRGTGLVEDGQVLIGARALAVAIRRLRAEGDVRRATAVLDDARARLEAHGRPAVAILDLLAPSGDLTDREREVARLVAEGLTNQAVADRLHVSVRTVENHLHRAFRKLGIDGRDRLADALDA
ncbi:LuxR C-terminal-related transcriptional regulator [Cellulosimicrobium composti]|uniref:HTH luxR-type domain-containing protein n=1 Tax=Cellulosimicrobium composti TaxID=2672572 RepID=A0ABX0BGI9_9MICO|nr:LuxR C-terminal-related transcriptional regulator [Cellulosimicrobium composti]NDO91162.1 hypothetical protein [Cellulosimicrobium composti]